VTAARVRALLGGAEYRRVLAAARERLEADGDARTVSVAELDASERRALAGLLGAEMVPGGPVRIDLARLDAALRESAAGVPLRAVLEALGGPLRDRRAGREAERLSRDEAWAAARARLEAAGRAELLGWLDGLRRAGLVAKAARAAGLAEAALLARAIGVVSRLPASGVLLPVFATTATGDSHALDAGTPLAGIVLRAAAALAGRAEVPADAAGRRALWREVGVECDSLSSDVLVLGLRPRGDGRLGRHLCESAGDGEPRRITLRELGRAGSPEGLSVESGSAVFVCENPAVVEAAADALGSRCAAMVCLEGVRSTAAHVLLEALARAGARVRVHADFDWAGLRIAGEVLAATGGEPWRFGAADYRAALVADGRGPVLAGPVAASPWDASLAVAMEAAGVAVAEEATIDQLLGDLEPR
jgi:uncharacterized protein (TIGR02679 family)